MQTNDAPQRTIVDCNSRITSAVFLVLYKRQVLSMESGTDGGDIM